MKKEDRKKLYKLLDEWTRAETVARHGHFGNLAFGDYAMIALEKTHEIRELLYGTSNLVELGMKWKIIESAEEHQKRMKRNARRKPKTKPSKRSSGRNKDSKSPSKKRGRKTHQGLL